MLAMYPGTTPGDLLVHCSIVQLRQLNDKVNNLPNYKLYDLASRKIWPQSVEQILSHGPEQTVGGSLDWLSSDHVHLKRVSEIMQAFAAVIDLGRPLVLPAMIKTCRFPQLFANAALRWSYELVALTREPLSTTEYHELAEYIAGLFVQLSVIMRTICSDYIDPIVTAVTLKPYHEEVITACDRMIATAAFVHGEIKTEHGLMFLEDVVHFLTPVGMAIYRHFPECRVRSVHLAKYRNVTMERAQRSNVPHAVLWTKLFGALSYQVLRQQCAMSGCIRNTEHHGREFRFCAGCRHVQYCSRSCQKRAWQRNDALQHRDVCAFIHNICAQHKISHETCTSDKDAPELDIPVLSQAEVYMVRKIIEHFAALSMHDIRV
jgi:hypothetical protein